MAATGLAATELWELKTGRRQNIAVDLRRAAASLRGGRYMKLGEGRGRDEQNPIMGVYPTRDGRWGYIHANFPNHLAAALRVLGCEANRNAVAEALAGWNAFDFEEALIAAKGAEKFAMYSSWPEETPAATIDCSVAVVSPPTMEPIVF